MPTLSALQMARIMLNRQKSSPEPEEVLGQEQNPQQQKCTSNASAFETDVL